MKTKILALIFTTVLFMSCTNTVLAPTSVIGGKITVKENVYPFDGSLYHAVAGQCDATPLITGSGFKIDPYRASEQRILAISPDLLKDSWRLGILLSNNVDTTLDNRFRGELCYGDRVWVESPRDSLGQYIYPELNGWWRVEDAKNKRYVESEIKFDFLQTVGDKSLYNNNPMWNGKFEGVEIYKYSRHDRS